MKILLISSVIIAICTAAQVPPKKPIPILKQSKQVEADGSYSYSYETGNGIKAIEIGEGGHFARGFVKWTSPEGIPVEISYVADKYGYRAEGNVLPVAPPIPEAILRSLEYIKNHSYDEEDQEYDDYDSSNDNTSVYRYRIL